MNKAFLIGLSLLSACAELREATVADVRAAAKSCSVRVTHFGPYYRFDGEWLPDNRVDIAAGSTVDFESKAECLEEQLEDRGVRAAVFGPNDQERM